MRHFRELHICDGEAVAVYGMCASYRCQTARFGKAFVRMMRTTFVLALLLSAFGSSRAIAQNTPTWSPNRPVRIVVPFQAGGPIDSIGACREGTGERVGRLHCRRG